MYGNIFPTPIQMLVTLAVVIGLTIGGWECAKSACRRWCPDVSVTWGAQP